MKKCELSETLGQQYSIYPEAFDFLSSSQEAEFDMTSAEPLHPRRCQILPPEKVLKLVKGGGDEFDFDDVTEVRGTSRGETATLEKCVEFFRRHRINCNLENVSLSYDILSALSHVYKGLGLPGGRKKILVPTPTFGYYFKQFQEDNISFTTLPTRAENNFLPDIEELRKAIIDSGASVILLCYPNNPTGSIMTEECAVRISRIAKELGVFVISDEAFLNNSLSENRHFSYAAVEGALENSFTITSPAKSIFASSKTGFCVGNQDIINSFEKLGGYPTKHSQKITAAAIDDNEENSEYLHQCRQYYLNNINVIKTKSAELNKVFCDQFSEEKIYVKPFIPDPDATNVYLMEFSGLRGKEYGGRILNTGLDVAKWLLNESAIRTVPGECYIFDETEMLVRVTLNRPPQEFELAFNKMVVAAASIQKSPERSPSPKTYAGTTKTNDHGLLDY